MGAEGGGGATRGSPPAPKRGRGTEVCKEHASRREGAMLCLCKITPHPHRCPVPGRGAWSGGARGSVVFVWLLPARHPVFLAPGAGGRVALLLSDPHRVVFGHHPVITSPLEEVTLQGGRGGGGRKININQAVASVCGGGDGAAERGSGVVNSRAGGGEREQSRDHPHLFPAPPRVLRARSGEAEEEEEEEEEEAVRCHPCGCGALPGGRRGRRGVQWGCVSPPHPR